MPEIKVLASHVADLIAAGEVVERPASVAKELMENAIDAGADKVTVEIANGGMTFLRVTDNGKGIPAGELQTAFLRHATSKLRTEYDLEAIGTLGFRGEALAAIAAVSRIQVMSRTADAPLGASLSLEAGVPGPVEESGCPLGTTMVIRDLFFNTPARLKFMKKDSAEGAAVFAVVQKVALSHPEVSVRFIRDGRQDLLTPGDGKLRSAVYAVLGRELALGFREVKAEGEEMTVTGFTSLPACCRNSRSWQFFFVNGRQVKSALMMAALEEAYKNQKMVGRFPACVLHLETKLNAVDVNVHPAKTEVKFGSERQVFSAVYHAVLSALEMDRSHPDLVMKEQTLPGWKGADTVTPNQTRLAPAPAPKPAAPAPKPAAPAPVSKPAAPVVRPAEPVLRVQDTTYDKPAAPAPRREEPVRNIGTIGHVDSGKTTLVQRLLEDVLAGKKDEKPAPAPEKQEKPAEKVYAPVENPVEIVESSEISTPDPVLSQPPVWRVAGEVLNTYIIVEQGDEVYFIDKHAAHERMNFDRMKAEGYRPMAQTLLVPSTCRLAAEEQEVLLANLPLLEEFGFDVDELGGGLAVRQAPFDVDVEDIPATLEEIARKLLTTGTADPAAARDGLLHTMACKAAIKGGWKSGAQELERVARAVMDGSVKYCPHGRPVAIRLTQKELEKQFKRI